MSQITKRVRTVGSRGIRHRYESRDKESGRLNERQYNWVWVHGSGNSQDYHTFQSYKTWNSASKSWTICWKRCRWRIGRRWRCCSDIFTGIFVDFWSEKHWISRVAAHSDKNRMQSHNLAIMFGPTLFHGGEEKPKKVAGKKDKKSSKKVSFFLCFSPFHTYLA